MYREEIGGRGMERDSVQGGSRPQSRGGSPHEDREITTLDFAVGALLLLAACISLAVLMAFYSKLYYAAIPLLFSPIFVDLLFRRERVVLHAGRKRVTVKKKSLWKKGESIVEKGVADVVIENLSHRKPDIFGIRLKMDDKTIVTLKTTGFRNKAIAYRREIANLLGIWD
jgi:hypothetical protein